MSTLSPPFWKERRVLVTGHMGFKGAWLACLLARLGAHSTGFGKDDRAPLLYHALAIPRHQSVTGDVNDIDALAALLRQSRASVLFHLAAQPIVLASYADPIRTFRDNVMGTASVLQAARLAPDLAAIVIVTSDKVYENSARGGAFHETDPLGGHDPYSASKAAADIVARSMFRSFFHAPGMPGVATARAGNVIGGGDWADHRLLPDAARAFARGEAVRVRNPAATRPWQHVLEPLVGYLQLAQALAADPTGIVSDAWNFGPAPEDSITVEQVITLFAREWGGGARWQTEPAAGAAPHEAAALAVDAGLARARLGWEPKWRVGEAVRRTAVWYRDHAAGKAPADLMAGDIEAYLATPAMLPGQERAAEC